MTGSALFDHRHLLGAPVRDRIIKEVQDYVKAQSSIGKLVSISIAGPPEVAVYIRNQARLAQKAGIPFDE